MPRPKWTLNTIYISERLQERLRPISRCALTTVVAPMGYGKTTAVNWYLAGRAKAEDATVVRISVYSDHPVIFWKSVQDAFEHAGLPLLRGYAFPDDAAGASLLADDLCHSLAGRGSVYIFIDDFHLLTDGRITEFLCALVNRLPENVHLIVASRDRFLPGDAVVRLGSRVYPIGAEHLRLNHTELSIYAHRCGTDLTDAQVETLLHASEGWFSAVYLNLRTLSERGALPDRHSDIYTMFSAAMIEPLSPRQQEFLAVMGLADEFTAPMAHFITGDPDTDRLLTMLTEQNAFVTRLPDGVSYRFHHMMKVCAEQAFAALPEQTRRAYHGRYGAWYAAHGQYLHALAAYRKGEDYDAVLQVIQDDAGILLAALSPEEVLAFLDACPRDTLQAHPLTLLVLMRRMFTWQQIPKMLELRALLLAGIEAHPELPDAERDNLLGECDLIMSFLQYNDIAAMSRLHRSAAARMTRPAISIRNEGSWTFGSPSVLMMFHRTPGQLGAELDAMNACMPHYYRLTNGHGQGAERIMDAEAAFLRGHFADAAIFLERARAAIAGNGQENMALCCDFLERRLALCVDTAAPEPPAHKRAALLAQHDTMWLRIFDSACAYCAALTGQTEQIPALFRDHALHTVHLLAPCRPMMEMIENQVYLAVGQARGTHRRAPDQRRDRAPALPLGRQRKAVRPPDLCQARPHGRREVEAAAADRPMARKTLTTGEWFSHRSTVQWPCTVDLFIPGKGEAHMYRKYIAAVQPLSDHVLQVDFVSGSRLLLDMKPYLDKLRFQPLSDPETWRSAVTNGIFVRFGNVELSHDELLTMAEHS